MRKLEVPLYTENAFSVYKGTQYSHIRAHVKLGAWMGAGFNLEYGLLFYFSITIWACALICEFSVPYMWMLGALICEYWEGGVLIRGNWVSLYSSYGHALIFGTHLIYEKLVMWLPKACGIHEWCASKQDPFVTFVYTTFCHVCVYKLMCNVWGHVLA